jgi:hypothetical protein
MQFNCSRAPCCSQGTNRSVPSFGAFENLARDVPARLMCFSAAWQELTCPFERKFHIGSHSRSKAVRKHDNPSVSDGLNYIGQIENEKKEKKIPPDIARLTRCSGQALPSVTFIPVALGRNWTPRRLFFTCRFRCG